MKYYSAIEIEGKPFDIIKDTFHDTIELHVNREHYGLQVVDISNWPIDFSALDWEPVR